MGLLLSVGSLVFAVSVSLQVHTPAQPNKGPTLEQRIDSLTSSLKGAAATTQQIEGEVQARQALLARLQADAHTYEQLIKVDKPQADAVAQVLRGELAKSQRTSLWQQIAIDAAFFLLGLLAHPALKVSKALLASWKGRRQTVDPGPAEGL
jgi:hypothetical protein